MTYNSHRAAILFNAFYFSSDIKSKIRLSYSKPTSWILLPGKLDGDSAPHALGCRIFSKYASWLLLKIVAT